MAERVDPELVALMKAWRWDQYLPKDDVVPLKRSINQNSQPSDTVLREVVGGKTATFMPDGSISFS